MTSNVLATGQGLPNRIFFFIALISFSCNYRYNSYYLFDSQSRSFEDFMKKGFLIIIALLLGCTTNHKKFYENYNINYNKKNKYKTHRVARNGYWLYAREFGPEKRGKLPSILLLHGFPDSLHLYDLLIPHLANKRHIIAFDFLGWGKSDKPKTNIYNTESLKKDLEAVIEHFKLQSLELVSHDLSAFPAIDWALDNESRVEKLIILNSVYFPSKKLVPPEAIARFSEDSISRDISVWFAKTVDAIWQRGHEKQISKFFCNKEVANTFVKIFNYQSFDTRHAFFEMNKFLLEEVANRKSRIPEMRNFSKPVTIIFGKEDKYLNSEVAQEFHDIFKNTKLHLIKGGCHYVQMDKPQSVARFILEDHY